MAVIGNTNLTLLDFYRRMDPQGGIDDIVELLKQRNDFLDDINWMAGNLPTGHKFTSRNSLPTIEYRRFNRGVGYSKSTTKQVTEVSALAQQYSRVDVDEADINGNATAYRASEDNSFMQAFPNELMRAFLYESVTVNPDRLQGLTPRLNSTSGIYGSQIIKADATASGNDQTSIWLVCWGDDAVSAFTPKGFKSGIQSIDRGVRLVADPENSAKQYSAYVTEWKWHYGLMVRDFRKLVRICNIDVSALKEDASSGAVLYSAMRKAQSRIFQMSGTRPAYYMNRTTFDMFNAQLQSKQSNFLEWVDRGGVLIPKFMGVPIRIVDALTNTESVVS